MCKPAHERGCQRYLPTSCLFDAVDVGYVRLLWGRGAVTHPHTQRGSAFKTPIYKIGSQADEERPEDLRTYRESEGERPLASDAVSVIPVRGRNGESFERARIWAQIEEFKEDEFIRIVWRSLRPNKKSSALLFARSLLWTLSHFEDAVSTPFVLLPDAEHNPRTGLQLSSSLSPSHSLCDSHIFHRVWAWCLCPTRCSKAPAPV